VPEIGPNDVLIKVRKTAICGTDVHIYNWDQWAQKTVPVPMVTGHEFVGTVSDFGAAVTEYKLGQRVSGEGHIVCGHCRNCRVTRGHLCRNTKGVGVNRPGSFGEYVAIPQHNVVPIPDDIPDEVAAIFDPLGNAVHTVMSAGVSGRSVLITGVGIIGLMAVTVARAAGAGRILVTDVDPRRLALAKELGADEAYSAKEDWVADARRATHGQGPQVLLEMSGNAKAIRQGFAALRNGGTAALLGIPGDEVSFDLANDIIFKGATVLGINGRRMFETWYQMESFLLSGRLDLEPIVTHRIPMTDYLRGFRMMQSGEAIKVVLEIPRAE
ncbi:MAG TPA: L-threonine 3-dehydrogenase, partial [Planctomycetaceae bacterium]|nr:L-threonine 3-dehydrogenase [Planctomycetaceae bacterium]